MPTYPRAAPSPYTPNPSPHEMKQSRSFSALLFAAFLLVCNVFTACSEDENNPKYASLPPEIVGVEVQPLGTPDGQVKAGEPFVVRAIQQKKGHLLYKAIYEWKAAPTEEGVTHKYTKQVVYDNQPTDPTDTLVIDNPGQYTIKLNATYYMSGSYQIINKTNEWEGGKATHSTASSWQYKIDLEHKVLVK